MCICRWDSRGIWNETNSSYFVFDDAGENFFGNAIVIKVRWWDDVVWHSGSVMKGQVSQILYVEFNLQCRIPFNKENHTIHNNLAWIYRDGKFLSFPLAYFFSVHILIFGFKFYFLFFSFFFIVCRCVSLRFLNLSNVSLTVFSFFSVHSKGNFTCDCIWLYVTVNVRYI